MQNLPQSKVLKRNFYLETKATKFVHKFKVIADDKNWNNVNVFERLKSTY